MTDYPTDKTKALEESFFHELEQEQLEALRKKQGVKKTRDALKEISGIDDESLLDCLLNLNISPTTFSALSLTPLVEVAWADGKMEDQEREAILKSAAEMGMVESSEAFTLLKKWLDKRPSKELSATWADYVGELKDNLKPDDFSKLRDQVLDRARRVAESAGGFLGMGNKVSDEEEQVLTQLRAAFGE